MKKIIFLADLNNYGRSYQRYIALCNLGYEVIPISYTSIGYYPGITQNNLAFVPSILFKIFNKLGYPLDVFNINKKLLDLVKFFRPNIVWCEKPLMLKHTTLRLIKESFPNIKITFYSEDDMFARHNQSKYFIKGLSFYDVIFTTKSYNCNPNELPSLGAKKVIFIDNSFCKHLHKPLKLSKEEKKLFGADVSFVGTFEKDRAEKMLFLAKNGIKVRIWGNGWSNWVNKHKNLLIENKPVYNLDYIRVLNASKINLCFLRKINRDKQTSRSIEIPASGAFVLAERTDEHLRLFKESKEAEFFDFANLKELLEKVNYYLINEEKRKLIAKAGRERCVKSGYSHQDRLKYMLKFVEE